MPFASRFEFSSLTDFVLLDFDGLTTRLSTNKYDITVTFGQVLTPGVKDPMCGWVVIQKRGGDGSNLFQQTYCKGDTFTIPDYIVSA